MGGRWTVACVAFSVLAGCAPGRGVGDPCDDASECPGGICQDIGLARRACTQSCDAGSPCPGGGWVCSQGVCQAPCGDGTTRGEGAELAICVGQVFVACSAMDAVASCARCGCEPFGGGVCLTGRGCVPPAPDGTACTSGEECASGACFSDTSVCGAPRADGEECGAAADCAAENCLSDTGTCGAPRAMGGTCLGDDDCETSNCSTNGIGTTAGTCLQTLGSPCQEADGTCQRCVNEDVFLGIRGRCFRNRCDRERAPTCPSFDRHQYVCQESVMPGESYCYERCLPDEDGDSTFHNCYADLDSCIGGGSFCS